jgi:hypothetical protein
MSDMSGSTLSPAQAAASQQAAVDLAVAQARTAALGADSAALTLAQTKYKSLVPDLTGVAMNSVTDSSTGAAFSGLVTYSALNHAAQIVANRIVKVLSKSTELSSTEGKSPSILVTSESDLLTNDLLLSAIKNGITQIADFGKRVLNLDLPTKTPEEDQRKEKDGPARVEPLMAENAQTPPPAADVGAIAAGAAVAASSGPLGIAAAAAAAAIPSIISLFSTTTTVKDQVVELTNLATTTAVVAAASDRLSSYILVHEDFRLAPISSPIMDEFDRLSKTKADLLLRQETIQVAKNDADLQLAQAQLEQDSAAKASPPTPVDENVQRRINDETNASANAAAVLSLIASAINDIDTFTSTVNATAVGARSPLAIAALTELLHRDEKDGGLSFVLSVTGLGGQSEEFTKTRHLGHSGYTTLADASISFLLYDIANRKIISSGVANGVSSVHGVLGEPPTGLIGPNAENVIDDETQDAGIDLADESSPASAGTDAPHGHSNSGWHRMFGPVRHLFHQR